MQPFPQPFSQHQSFSPPLWIHSPLWFPAEKKIFQSLRIMFFPSLCPPSPSPLRPPRQTTPTKWARSARLATACATCAATTSFGGRSPGWGLGTWTLSEVVMLLWDFFLPWQIDKAASLLLCILGKRIFWYTENRGALKRRILQKSTNISDIFLLWGDFLHLALIQDRLNNCHPCLSHHQKASMPSTIPQLLKASVWACGSIDKAWRVVDTLHARGLYSRLDSVD